MISARRVEYRQGTPLVLVATKITKKKFSRSVWSQKIAVRMLQIKNKYVHLHHQNGNTSLWHGESVAQQVEHNTFNVGVLGSSPSGFTREEGRVAFLFFCWGPGLPPRRNPEPSCGRHRRLVGEDRPFGRRSSPSGFTKYPATDMLPDIFLRGALTFGYLLAETPNRKTA